MGSRGRLLFDLNEPPAEDDECDSAPCLQPQKALPSTSCQTPDLLVTPAGSQEIVNNHAFSHVPSGSGFQPFTRPKASTFPEVGIEPKRGEEQNFNLVPASLKSNNSETKGNVEASPVLGSANAQAMEREEGEWSDAEGSANAYGNSNMPEEVKASQEQIVQEVIKSSASGVTVDTVSATEKSHSPLRPEHNLNDQKGNNSQNSEGSAKGDISVDHQEEPGLLPKQKEIKGIEASHALKCANNPGKRKIDQQKEAMLGKKRNRKTMFLNYEDVKQAGPIKTSITRKQNFSSPVVTRTVKEVRSVPQLGENIGEKQGQPVTEDQNQVDLPCNEGSSIVVESCDIKSGSNGNMNSGLLARPRRLNSDAEHSEAHIPPILRQSSWKQPIDSRQLKSPQFSNRKPASISQSSMHSKMVNKKHFPSKKTSTSTSYQDTSVERLIREVTNEKFWHHPVIHVPSIITL